MTRVDPFFAFHLRCDYKICNVDLVDLTFNFIWFFSDGRQFDRIQERAFFPIDHLIASDYQSIDKCPFFLVWSVDGVFASLPILFCTIQLTGTEHTNKETKKKQFNYEIKSMNVN